MKATKKLLRTSLALLLVFFSLCGGLVVHAEQSKGSTAFSSIKLNGAELNLDKYPEDYTITDYSQSTAKVEWTISEGWDLYAAVYATNDSQSYNYKDFKSGASLKVPSKGSTEIILSAVDKNNEDNYAVYEIFLFSGMPSLAPATLWVGSGVQSIEANNLPFSAPVTSITSSNSSVLQVKKGSALWSCGLTPKKAGKSTITMVVKVNGVKHTIKGTYTVKKYPAPLTSLKVAGKSIDLKKNKFSASKKVSKNKVKVNFKVKKGWKLTQCRYYDFSKGKYVSFKSGGTVNTSKGYTTFVEITMKKGSDLFTYNLELPR